MGQSRDIIGYFIAISLTGFLAEIYQKIKVLEKHDACVKLTHINSTYRQFYRHLMRHINNVALHNILIYIM